MKLMKGGLTLQEAIFLRHLSESTAYGDLLEIGAYRGMSAVALHAGLRQTPGDIPRQVYCIEPHRAFVGVYGGRFGPDDRAGFYRTMLRSGAYRDVALINLDSSSAARGWRRPIGLAFIDGDHTYAGVSEDIRNWVPHLTPGGLLVFDDALDDNIGPHRIIQELLASGSFRQVDGVGKIVALRKESETQPPPLFAPEGHRRILVVTSEIYMNGGMLRFERAGRELVQQGHEVVFCSLLSTGRPSGWTGTLPVIDKEEAWCQKWDVTMLPGRAGFDEGNRKAWLRLFTDTRFGLRIQHILNDRTFEETFLALNREFQPHLVIFNNNAWPPGSFEQFSANEFHVLPGGIDCHAFSACRPRSTPGEVVIGGQVRKTPAPLLACLDHLPATYRLRLFGDIPPEVAKACRAHQAADRIELCGTLTEAELPGFYCGVDVVVSTETHAGWSNLVAEAMAAGIPVICTPAGTENLAIDGVTALIIPQPHTNLIIKALERLQKDSALKESMVRQARELVSQFDWKDYSLQLLELTQHGRHPHYYQDPTLNMFGKWPAGTRLIGLETLLTNVAGKSVLDIGTAEGLVAKACLDAGATRVDGLDIDAKRIERARNLCGHAANLYIANLNDSPDLLLNGPLAQQYDVVLYLGVHHHLDQAIRAVRLQQLAALCRETLVLRTTIEAEQDGELHTAMQVEGFNLTQETREGANGMGPLWIYTRR